MMNTLLQDFRYGLRVLIKSPGFTIIAILTLALGIGANSTIFSWINSTVLNPIPGVKHTSQYVEITTGGERNNPFSYPDYADLRDRNRSFSSLFASSLWPMNLTGSAKPQRVWGTLVSANYFDALGVRPVLGRGFLPVEGTKPDGSPVVVISYRLWQTQFGGDRSIIGRTIEIDKHSYTVIGVAPPVFQGDQTGLRVEMWIPLMMAQQFVTDREKILEARATQWIIVHGRLKSGVTLEQAQADMNVLMQRIAKQFPDSHRGDIGIVTHPLWKAPFGANYYLRTILLLLMTIAGVVLLLACANVASLLLVRSVARRREMAIRLSIGATRWRLIRQLLAESIILAICGGGIAMLFTLWTSGTLNDFIPPVNLPISMSAQADRTVLLATLAISVLTGMIFGILPALRSSSLQPASVLKEDSGSMAGGVHKARLSSILVVAQIAMSLLLLVCAGLFIRSFRVAQQFNPGFNPDHVLLYSYDLAGLGYDQKSGTEFDRQLLDKLKAIPGAESATLADWVPLGMNRSSTTVNPEGYIPQPHESMDVRSARVGPNYLRTMQIPLVAGRDFGETDTPDSQPVAIVNQEFVKRYWPGQDAIGKRVEAGGKWFTVAGVAQNSDTNDLGQKATPFIYFPLFQDYDSQVAIHVRVAGNPLAFVSPVQRAVHSLDADLPLFDLTTLESQINLNTTAQRMGGVFVGGFGIVALILAAIGIYGVLAYTTRQRTHEIGIRMALGAEPRDVFSLVLRQGAMLTLLGLAIGVGLSLVLTRALSSQLFGVTATDPLTFGGVALLLLFVALVACYIPARRAMRTDPMVALRYE